MDVYMNATPSDLRLCRTIWKRMLPLNANSLSERKGDLRSRKIARFGLDYRQWAFIQLNNVEQFYCLDELNYKESRWNPKAKNGSHHGIPQGRSKWLATVDGYKQIDWQLKYIKKRYSNPCNALQHHKIKGWY